MRALITGLIAAAGVAGLAGCAADTESRNLVAPGSAAEAGAERGKAQPRLGLARVSTKSGEILILEPDGSVTPVALDSPAGRDAFEVTEADLAALEVNLGLDLSAADIAGFDVVAPERRRMPTAQQKALEEFAARTRPALPDFPDSFKAEPANFIAVRVDPVQGDRKNELVEVTANLKAGVDPEVAFAYATCALAGWAKTKGKDYGRHIRTLQNQRNGKLLTGSVFTLSDKKPMGLRVMETDQTLRTCKDRGIPAA